MLPHHIDLHVHIEHRSYKVKDKDNQNLKHHALGGVDDFLHVALQLVDLVVLLYQAVASLVAVAAAAAAVPVEQFVVGHRQGH